MEWDIEKLADFLETKGREGVAIENKIYEWRLAEQRMRAEQDAAAVLQQTTGHRLSA